MLNKIHFAVNHRIYRTCLALIFVYFVHFYRLGIYTTRGKTRSIKLEYIQCTKVVNSAYIMGNCVDGALFFKEDVLLFDFL